ncbi:hypothetical protein TNCV_1366931 [Trichonephila clavipes]|nr:hypothetical protein TNCV_1366931 [Trichonephila clavipes]
MRLATSGLGRLVVKVTESIPSCHEFEPSTAEDRCSLNFPRSQTSSRWCGGESQLVTKQPLPNFCLDFLNLKSIRALDVILRLYRDQTRDTNNIQNKIAKQNKFTRTQKQVEQQVPSFSISGGRYKFQLGLDIRRNVQHSSKHHCGERDRQNHLLLAVYKDERTDSHVLSPNRNAATALPLGQSGRFRMASRQGFSLFRPSNCNCLCL